MKWLAVVVGAVLGAGAAAVVAQHMSAEDQEDELLTFVKAKGFGAGAPGRRVDVIVLHTTDPPRGDPLAPGVARSTAGYFAGGSDGRNTSSHYIVGPEEAIQAVRDDDVAYHAKGINDRSIGVELTARAAFGADTWADERAERMLRRAAVIVARVALERDVPIALVDADGLRAGARGITTHAAVSAAFRQSDHVDPGAAFPMEHFLELVRGAQAVA